MQNCLRFLETRSIFCQCCIITIGQNEDYRLTRHNFLTHLKADRVKKLCVVAETDEKLFWKLLNGQLSSSQMSAFFVNGELITEENDKSEMWADHFEALGTPTVSLNFDNEFANSISTHIQNIFQNYINDPTGALILKSR